MTAIANNSFMASLGIGARIPESREGKDANTMAQDDFFQLMIAQLKHQDPNKPLDPNEYLSQMTTFSMVEGIQSLNDSFEEVSRSLRSLHALQGASLVGRSVLVEGDSGYYDGQGALEGSVQVEGSETELSVGIYNSGGQLVRRLPVNTTAGEATFSWDGLDETGAPAAPGHYSLRATGKEDHQTVALSTRVKARVESVILDPAGQGLVLNLVGLGARDIDAIQAIH